MYLPNSYGYPSIKIYMQITYICARLSLQLVYMQAHVCMMLSLSVVTAFTIYFHYLDT